AIVRQNGIPIAEFAAIIHLDGHTGQLLDHEFSGKRGVPTGSAGYDPDLAKFLELLWRDVHLIEKNASRFLSDAAQSGVTNGAGLLINLFQHEVAVAALLGHGRVPQYVRNLAVHWPAIEIAQAHTVGSEHRHVA